MVNLYGPTEDTTYSTHAHLAPGEMPPPIGVLLPPERGYVLDRALRRGPVGVWGGLYLAGSSTNPGGGVPTVIASGMIAAALVQRYEN